MAELRNRRGGGAEEPRSDSMLEEVRRSTEDAGNQGGSEGVKKDVPAVMQQGFWKKFAVRAQTATLMMAAFVSIARSRGVASCLSRAARGARPPRGFWRGPDFARAVRRSGRATSTSAC